MRHHNAGDVLTLPAGIDGASGAGHVAYIKSATSLGGNRYLLDMEGTVQGTNDDPQFTEFSCNNVTDINLTVTVGDRSQYWYT